MNNFLKKIISYDAKGYNNEYLDFIRKKVKDNNNINFVVFTCSTINPQYLWSKKPWLYVSTNPNGNNLEQDLSRLNKIIIQLKKIKPKTGFTIIIGNTDPYYIYLQQFKNLDKKSQKIIWKEFIARWRKYKNNFRCWINKEYPGLNPKIISWYEFENNIEKNNNSIFESEFNKIYSSLSEYFPKKHLEIEQKKLEKQFGPEKYFSGLKKPNDKIIKDWVNRKFSEYAMQGKWIYQYIPNSILIQNEKPSDLRSLMYQPLIKKYFSDCLPIVYFLGIENEGYQ